MQHYDRSKLGYFELVKEAKAVDSSSLRQRFRLALLSDSSTQHLVPLLKALFARAGVAVDIYESPYDAIRQETLDPSSGLYAFKPDAVAILNDARALREAFFRAETSSEQFAEKTADSMVAVWQALADRCPAAIVQATMAVPYDRLFGQFDEKAGLSLPSAVRRINGRLIDAARGRGSVLLCDVEAIASYAGLKRWFDEKLWVLCKAPCAFDCLPHLAQGLLDAVGPLLGRVTKCVVVDLDNTLWGGTIGDDGLEGIRLGHSEDGEAFAALQRFLVGLKRRGILLAVCSRNERETALSVFRQHPEMSLKEEDIAVFVANWQSKAENLKTIRETLDIGFDSMVFVDDDPFERNLIRASLPEVVVPELPADPSDYVKVLCESGLCEAASFSREDRDRTGMYAAQALRRSRQTAFTTAEEYLRSLNMRIALARFDAFHLPRIAQLISRSNQFNLTTKRYTEGDCERFMRDEAGCFPFYVTMKDDLGDSGLIAAAILLVGRGEIEIDLWLMSCRVLMRGVEEYMMNSVFAFARRGCFRRVIGRYRPTAKNEMVREFYGRFDFIQEAGPSSDGSTAWVLDVDAYRPRTVFFEEEGIAQRHG